MSLTSMEGRNASPPKAMEPTSEADATDQSPRPLTPTPRFEDDDDLPLAEVSQTTSWRALIPVTVSPAPSGKTHRMLQMIREQQIKAHRASRRPDQSARKATRDGRAAGKLKHTRQVEPTGSREVAGGEKSRKSRGRKRNRGKASRKSHREAKRLKKKSRHNGKENQPVPEPE